MKQESGEGVGENAKIVAMALLMISNTVSSKSVYLQRQPRDCEKIPQLANVLNVSSLV